MSRPDRVSSEPRLWLTGWCLSCVFVLQQGELVLSSDEGVLLVDQHEPLLHHGLLLLLVVPCRTQTHHAMNTPAHSHSITPRPSE